MKYISFVILFFLSTGARAQITGTLSVCEASTTALNDGGGGGTWTVSSSAIATIGSSSGIVTGVTAGTTTVSYTIGGTTDVATVTINPVPAPISGPSSVSVGQVIPLSDATPGGSWSISNPSMAKITASGNAIAGTTTGSATITYTLLNGCSKNLAFTVSP